MNTPLKLVAGAAGAYVALALYAKMTGALGVGPKMSGEASIAQVSAWERVRWERAFQWPRSLLPSLGSK